ncbi:MAG: FHA domain-containing protein [Chloroflexi bacterium]|nr:MAG: FHA domain-containing protein [Chloroflexota bacterium]
MQGNDSFRLIVRRGPQPNQIYELKEDVITLGRDITNNIVINDPEVSRHHLRLTRGAGSYTVEDLGSTNGTFVNGQRLTGAKPLSNGDTLGLGETVTLGYEIVAAGAASEPPPMSPGPQAGGTPGVYAGQQPPMQQPQQPAYQPIPESQAPDPVSYGHGEEQLYQQPGPPPPPSLEYDYDPYISREEEPRNTMRWVVIGCAGILLFCCCITVIGAVVVDQACLYDELPLVGDVLEVLGFFEDAAACL